MITFMFFEKWPYNWDAPGIFFNKKNQLPFCLSTNIFAFFYRLEKNVWKVKIQNFLHDKFHYLLLIKLHKQTYISNHLLLVLLAVQFFATTTTRCKGKTLLDVVNKHLKTCPAMFCLYVSSKLSAHNLTFHWRWRDRIQANIQHLLYFKLHKQTYFATTSYSSCWRSNSLPLLLTFT